MTLPSGSASSCFVSRRGLSHYHLTSKSWLIRSRRPRAALRR